jgi:uncharacterized membrane protein
MPYPLTAGKSRIEALSDGVFAIAMTLLVLKLEVPEVMHHSSNAEMLRQLLALGPALVTYVVTFLIAGGFWFLHHLTFHFIRNVSGVLIWVNLVFLMLVALLPFSAGLMSHLLVHPVSQLFYFGNQFAIALMLNVHWHYARRKNLLAKDGERLEMSHLSWRIGVVTAAFAAAIVAAIVDPPFSALAFLICFVAGVVLEHFRCQKV